MVNTFADQIKHLINTDSEITLDWRHPLNLPMVLEAYLVSKKARQPLAPVEVDLARAIATMFDPIAGSDGVIYVDPRFGHADQLVALSESEALTSLPALQQLGQQLDASALRYFSWHARQNWLAMSALAFQTVLSSFASQHGLTEDELMEIFGARLTRAYWPLSQTLMPEAALPMFWLLVQIDGEWLLALFEALKQHVDPDLLALLTLWLQWFAAEKSQVAGSDADLLAQVGEIIAALNRGEFTVAEALLMRYLPDFVD